MTREDTAGNDGDAPVGPLSCTAFEAHASSYLDDDVEPRLRATLERHLVGCDACARLLAELDAIHREAAALPPLTPSRDLWAGVESRIATPITRLAEAPPPGVVRALGAAMPRSARFRPRWLAAAAALLLTAAGAGVAHLLLRGPVDVVATMPQGSVVPPSSTTTPADRAGSPPQALPGEDEVTAPGTTGRDPGAAQPARQGHPAPSSARLAAERAVGGRSPDVVAAYAMEIARLRGEFDERRTSLDTSTVRILESNMAIIDRAIRESRAALAADPASTFLNQQLSDVMDEKLELMRTAVLLSSGA